MQRVERAFRDLKDTIKLRPIYHYEDVRVIRNELNGRVMHCVVQRRSPQADAILRALGLTPLPVVLDN